MAPELNEEVSDRLTRDDYGWLTTVAKSGQPVPKLLMKHFSGRNLAEGLMNNQEALKTIQQAILKQPNNLDYFLSQKQKFEAAVRAKREGRRSGWEEN